MDTDTKAIYFPAPHWFACRQLEHKLCKHTLCFHTELTPKRTDASEQSSFPHKPSAGRCLQAKSNGTCRQRKAGPEKAGGIESTSPPATDCKRKPTARPRTNPGRDGSVFFSFVIDQPNPSRREHLLHLFGCSRSGEIHILRRHSAQQIPHGPSRDSQLVVLLLKQF